MFGNSSNLFGGTGTASGGLFGSPANRPLFGGTQTTQASTSGGLFGSTTANQSAFGAATPFGATPQQATGSSLFGGTSGTTSGGLFGTAPTASSSIFGGTSTVGVTNGTTIKFDSPVGEDTMMRSGIQEKIKTRHMCITAMKHYESKSLEELRVEDYLANRKGPTQMGAGASGGFAFGGGTQVTPGTSGGLFSTSSTAAPAGGGLFGTATQSTGATTGGLFGASTAASKPLFGGTSTTGGGLFGAATTQPTTGGLFGGTAAKPGIFGATTSATPFGFGSTTQTTAGATTPFGLSGFGPTSNTSVGLFGGATQTTQSTGGLFGQTANKPLFGGTPATSTPSVFGTSTTGFGTPAAQPTTPFGTTNTTGGLFGQKPATSTAGFGTGTSLFGGTAGQPAAPTFGGFGTNTATTQNKPLFGGGATTNLFGQTQPTTGTTFGFANNASLFGNAVTSKPSLFGGQTGTGTMFGGTSFGQTVGTQGTLTTDQGTLQAQQELMRQQLIALTNSPYGEKGLFTSALPELKPEERLLPLNQEKQRELVNSTLHHFNFRKPNIVAGVRPIVQRSILRPSPRVLGSLRRPVPALLKKSKLFDEFPEDPNETVISSSPSFVPRKGVKQLTIRPKPSLGSGGLNVSLPIPQVSSGGSRGHGTRLNLSVNGEKDTNDSNLLTSRRPISTLARKQDDSNKTFPVLNLDETATPNRPVLAAIGSSQRTDVDLVNDRTPTRLYPVLDGDKVVNSKVVDKGSESTGSIAGEDALPELRPTRSSTGITLTRPEYYTEPSMDELPDLVGADGSCIVQDGFTVGRTDYGSVFWPGPIDVSGLNLDEIVHFRLKEVTVYPDDYANKPAVGQELNRPAEITLHRVWLLDKSTKSPIKSPQRPALVKFREKLEQHCVKMEAEFKDYRPETGSWVFKVPHFTKYGLEEDDGDESILTLEESEMISQRSEIQDRVQRTKISISPLKEQELGSLKHMIKEIRPETVTLLGKQAVGAKRDIWGRISPVQKGLGGVSPPHYGPEEGDYYFKSPGILDESQPIALKDRLFSNDSIHEDEEHLPMTKASALSPKLSERLQLMKESLFEDQHSSRKTRMQGFSPQTPSGLFQRKRSEGLTDGMTMLEGKTMSHLLKPFADDSEMETEESRTKRQKLFGNASFVDLFNRSSTMLTDTESSMEMDTPSARDKSALKVSQILSELKSKSSRAPSEIEQRQAMDGVSPRYALAQVPYDESILCHRSRQLIDAGCFHNRRFRPGWLPGQALLHLGEPLDEKEMGKIPHLRCALPPRLLPGAAFHTVLFEKWTGSSVEMEVLKTAMEANFKASSCRATPDTIPLFEPQKGTKLLTEMLEHVAVSGLHASVWRLCGALWEPMKSQRNESMVHGKYGIEMERKSLVSDWLKDLLEPDVMAEVEVAKNSRNNYISGVWSLLSGGRLAEAVKWAVRSKQPRLAAILGNVDNLLSGKLCERQLNQWLAVKADQVIDQDHLKIFCLLAGLLVWEKSDGGKVCICEGMDWKRVLGFFLWFNVKAEGTHAKESDGYYPKNCLKDVITLYESALKSGAFKVPYPVPAHSSEAKHGSADICYQLLKLYADSSYGLGKVLTPDTHTEDLSDYALSWHLYCVLWAIGYTRSSHEAMFHVNFAEQLIKAGLWTWAIFVLMHIPDANSREAAVKRVLSQQIGEMDETEEKFLTDELFLPSECIEECKALFARSQGRHVDECWHCIQAKCWNTAHRLFLQHVGPQAVIEKKNTVLGDFVVPLFEHCDDIHLWSVGGQIYYQYWLLLEGVDDLMKGDGKNSQPGFVEMKPMLISMIRNIKGLECSTALQRCARSEMGQFACSVLKIGLSDEEIVSLIPTFLEVPLPDDYHLIQSQEFAQILVKLNSVNVN